MNGTRSGLKAPHVSDFSYRLFSNNVKQSPFFQMFAATVAIGHPD